MIIKNNKKIQHAYSLLDDAFSEKDITEGIKVLRSKKITMSEKVKKFEIAFAKYIGVKYAIMVNSGSSANLLSVFAACNPMRKNRFSRNDEAIIPSLCWSTSLWPLVQSGLKPVFVDAEPKTLNMNIDDLKKKITSKTKVIMAVHVLGISTNISEIKKICRERNIILIEDTCESLGAEYKKKKLGTFGDFGTYSFYYSHQITSGEGGMIVCNNYNDYKILYSMRSHGWSRGINKNYKLKTKYKNLDKRFLFINSGFNLRPLDISAAIGNSQLKRIKQFIKIRNDNRNKIISCLKNSKNWRGQFEFIVPGKKITPSWFGLPILVDKKFINIKTKFLKYLEKNKIENRPIISGNFINQPCIELFKLKNKHNYYPGAEEIEKRGFFIGIHTKSISNGTLKYLANKLLNINSFLK
jgi:CDP-6-deoxy-D-xylo-4-hexulose-3-dehydrase